jgi:hypothetical protein
MPAIASSEHFNSTYKGLIVVSISLDAFSPIGADVSRAHRFIAWVSGGTRHASSARTIHWRAHDTSAPMGNLYLSMQEQPEQDATEIAEAEEQPVEEQPAEQEAAEETQPEQPAPRRRLLSPDEEGYEADGGPLGCCLGIIVGLLLSLVIAVLSRLYAAPLGILFSGNFGALGVVVRIIMALVAIAAAILCGYFGWRIGRYVYREYDPPVVKDRKRSGKPKPKAKPRRV